MKKCLLLALTLLLALSCNRNGEMEVLESGFKNPPKECRPLTMWHWMNGNVTKEGIRKDLQWMHDIGLSGFFLFDAANSTPQIVKDRLVYMSDGWKDAFRYAVALADSLGLEVGIASSPGWSLTGGPWVSAEDAQKKLVWSSIPISGSYRGPLPLPDNEMKQDLFEAVPEQKGIVGDYLKEICVLAIGPAADGALAVEDISAAYKDGILDWAGPRFGWKVYRFAYTLIGHKNGPAPPEATGLEVDKLDAGAVRRYWENYLGLYRDALGRELGPGTISNVDIDSYESGKGTWTPRMEEEFEARRGYPLRTWLPALAGATVGSEEDREQFFFDWRQTLGELLAENHYDAVNDILHPLGIRRYNEGHEERRTFVGDGMMIKRSADVPQSAFWVRFRAGVYDLMPHMEADLRESSSVAHIYGQNVCAAEAFTTNGRPGKWDGWWAYQCHPGKLKPVADAAMAQGLNKFVMHTSVHQPLDDVKPGLGLGPYGQWFNRHDTWADEARPWVDYLARSSYMLSRGRFIADIAYFYGEDTNPTARFAQERPAVPRGWNYDFVNGDALLNAIEIQGNELVSIGGARYRMLVIDGKINLISAAVSARIEEIRAAGIPVFDMRKGVNSDTSEASRSIESVLKASAIAEDVSNLPDSAAFVHRKLEDGEIYWIANICSKPRQMTLSLRDFAPSGRASGGVDAAYNVELWRADRATIEEVSYRVENGRMSVDLNLERDDAVFVVLRGRAESSARTVPEKKLLPIDAGQNSFSSWTVHFAPATDPEGAGADYSFDKLSPWNRSEDRFIRYFSGTAIYRTSFNWNAGPAADVQRIQPAASILLDLGRVCNMARVRLNGKDLGLLWKEPYSLDITEALQDGENVLEISVTNSWANRLIGDAALPEEQRSTWTSWEFYSPEDSLPDSGLLGPVQLFTCCNQLLSPFSSSDR